MPNIICPRYWLLIKYFTIAIQSKVAIRGRPSRLLWLAPVEGFEVGFVTGLAAGFQARFEDGFLTVDSRSDSGWRNRSRTFDGGIRVGL